MLYFQGWNSACEDCKPKHPLVKGPLSPINFTLPKGGHVDSQTKDEASITVFRNHPLQDSYKIGIPNEFLDARINGYPIALHTMFLGTARKTATFTYTPDQIFSGINHALVVRDKALDSAQFIVTPVYEIGLNPEDSVIGALKTNQ